jgi:putative transcriptional regulator
MLLENYKGRLLIAQPKNKGNIFEEGVVLMVNHTQRGSWGLMINRPIQDKDFCLADILEHVGMENSNYINAPLYVGGPVEKQRVCIVHSNDWASSTTVEITPTISVTTDISILAALCDTHGPEKYRVVCGVSAWAPGQLEGEMKGEEPWTTQHQWLTLPATDEFVFDLEPEAQWAHCLAGAVHLEVKEWF